MKRHFLTFAVILLVAGCNMTTPSEIKTGDIRLREGMKTVTLDAARPDIGRMDIVSEDFQRNGAGRMSMVVTYLSGSPKNEVEAQKSAVRVRDALAKRGVRNISIEYTPVDVRDDAGKAIVFYRALTALPPENCGRLTGIYGADSLENDAGYELGCETKSILSKMISQPEDLMGRSGTPLEDSRRQGSAVERYKAGTQNEKLDGMNASEVGTGG